MRARLAAAGAVLGVEQPGVVAGGEVQRRALGAQAAEVGRMRGIAAHTGDARAVVLDEYATADAAVGTGGAGLSRRRGADRNGASAGGRRRGRFGQGLGHGLPRPWMVGIGSARTSLPDRPTAIGGSDAVWTRLMQAVCQRRFPHPAGACSAGSVAVMHRVGVRCTHTVRESAQRTPAGTDPHTLPAARATQTQMAEPRSALHDPDRVGL